MGGHLDALASGATELPHPIYGPLAPKEREWRVDVLGNRWITNAVWPADTQEDLAIPRHKRPIGHGEWRYVTAAANDALDARLARREQAEEDARRAFFRMG